MAIMKSPIIGIIEIPVAVGELIDKITILQLKAERVNDACKLANIRRELALLEERRRVLVGDDACLGDLAARLKKVNGRIWELEDTIRECERKKSFEALFVETAREIYRTNDNRALVKREINALFGSVIVEEKSYVRY
jgi:hypothetical protein